MCCEGEAPEKGFMYRLGQGCWPSMQLWMGPWASSGPLPVFVRWGNRGPTRGRDLPTVV